MAAPARTKTLVQWIATRGASRDDFVRAHDHAVLLHRAQPETQEAGDTHVLHARPPLMTPDPPRRIGSVLRASEIPAVVAEDPNAVIVLPVDKKRERAFSGHISVGRTPNVDVNVNATGVSKFHAFFTRDEDGSYLLTDAGSTNGTFLNGMRLDPKVATKVPDGAVVRFSYWYAHFFMPERFYDLLEEVRTILPNR